MPYHARGCHESIWNYSWPFGTSLTWPLQFGVILWNMGSWHHGDIAYTVCVSNKLSLSIEVYYVLIGIIIGRIARTAQQQLLVTSCLTESQCHHIEMLYILQFSCKGLLGVFSCLCHSLEYKIKQNCQGILYKIIKILNIFLIR